MNERFTIMVIDGDAIDLADPETPVIRYDGLSWDDAVYLCRLSFNQGYELVLWRMDGGEVVS